MNIENLSAAKMTQVLNLRFTDADYLAIARKGYKQIGRSEKGSLSIHNVRGSTWTETLRLARDAFGWKPLEQF